MAKPTSATSSPPGYWRASSMNTGNTRNSPSMRNAKTSASEKLAWRSGAVMAVAAGARLADVGSVESGGAVIWWAVAGGTGRWSP